MQSRPTLALCVIARNEEHFIVDCLESARSFVDEIILVDTGSTDRTVELALEHGARLVSFPWINDFSAPIGRGDAMIRRSKRGPRTDRSRNVERLA